MHWTGVIASSLLAVVGLASIVLGAYAWSQERSGVVRLPPGVPVAVSSSPIFDPGSTIFAQGEDSDPPEPLVWKCTLIRDGVERQLEVKPDFDSVGSRVLKGEPYVPIVAVGTTVVGDQVRCDPPATATSDLAVMPTDVGVRSVPLAFVVGGIAALGIAGLVHPRGRGVRRFGT